MILDKRVFTPYRDFQVAGVDYGSSLRALVLNTWCCFGQGIHREIMPLGIAIYGMCHLMPRWHLPEWREEDEQVFVRRGSWKAYKCLDNTISHCQLHLQEVEVTDDTLESSVADSDVIAWFTPELLQCTNARSSSSLHSGRCCRGIKWHMPLLS